MNTIKLKAENGERLRFERWIFENMANGTLNDWAIIAALERCGVYCSIDAKEVLKAFPVAS